MNIKLVICQLGHFSIFPQTDDPANEHVLKAAKDVLANAKLMGHLMSGFTKLKLIIIPKVRLPTCTAIL